MKPEKIRILANDLGLEEDIDNLIRYSMMIDGEYSFTKKGKEADKQKHLPLYDALWSKVMKRVGLLLMPEFKDWKLSYGRLSDGSCYIVLRNPEYL